MRKLYSSDIFKRKLIFIIFSVVASFVSLAIFAYSGLNRYNSVNYVDTLLKEQKFHVRGEITPPSNILIVAIDHKSIKKLGRWPWSRDVMATLIENLHKSGVKVTTLDIIFADPELKNINADEAFKRSLRHKDVILGYFFRNDLKNRLNMYSSGIKPYKDFNAVLQQQIQE